MSNIVLSCHDLGKSYQEVGSELVVFHQLNLAVEQGEMVAIMGASGTGKSTLLHLLGGLDKPTQGSVLVNGHDLASQNEAQLNELHNRDLGFIYQFHHLLSEFNAWENVAMPLFIRGLSYKAAEEQALALLAKVGLSERSLHRVSELSGGERQRVAIARALVTQPKCVLADEPTGNLDESTAEQVFEVMLKLNQELGTSFVIVTHNAYLAEKMHRILVLEKGCLRACR